jgi:hypothetical protein
VVNIDVPNSSAKKPDDIKPIVGEPKTAKPPTVEMSNLLPQTASLDQVSAKEYLQLNVFPKLEVALNTVSLLA